MPVTVHNPYSGKDEETCSVSFEAQSKLSQTGVSGSQTEAQWSQSKLLGEWGVIQGKVANGQIPNGTKVLTYIKPSGAKGYIHVKNGKLHKVEFVGTQRLFDSEVLHPKDIDYWIKATGYKVSIPQAVAPKPKPEAVLLSGNDISSIDSLDIDKIPHGKVFAVNEAGDYVTFDGNFKNWQLHTEDPSTGKKTTTPGLFFEDLVHPGEGWLKPDGKTDTAKDAPKTTSGGKEHDSQVAAPTPASPVQGGDSVGSMSDEDVATMFVSIKDGMAKEQGLNIKGANPELDQQVYKAIGLKTGYTAAEVKGKIDQYKAAGNKLSALKKKVLSGNKKVPDPKPNDVPTKATATIVNDVKKTIVDEVKKEPAKHYSDEDVVAQYIIAKDQVVAESNGKWTLYTKSEELDKAIADQVKAKTGLDVLQQKHAMASYLGSGKKVSVLKKQLIKQGALKPQADTLKASKDKPKTAEEKFAELLAKKKEAEAKADEGYKPVSTPATSKPSVQGKEPIADDYPTFSQYLNAKDEWKAAGGKSTPVDTGKAAPNAVKSHDAELGDITGLSEKLKKEVFDHFKKQSYNSYLSSSASSNYEGFAQVRATFIHGHDTDLSLLQIMRIVDEQGAKKAGVENGHLFEKKMVTWLTTPEGTAHVKANEAKQASLMKLAKEKAEAEKIAKELEANQPALPADSDRFKVLPAGEAAQLQARMQEARPWTPKQRAALRHYTTNPGYVAMNGALRGEHKGTGTTIQQVKDAQAGMRPSDRDFLLHRGCDLRQVGLQGNPAGIWALPGKLLKDNGFMSTSYGGSAAFGGEVQIEFQVPAGSLMGNVKAISHYSHENEILLAAGTQYRVLRVESRGTNRWKVIVRVEGTEFEEPR